ncbi:uncharacterized protein LOC110114420, partial [Dendrobium catenatum]|uniref:uncharacterized protein LOC110114420 n=1 Tax=Dendrobium catenatum TaxID=906689 RepID=UPI00109FEB17
MVPEEWHKHIWYKRFSLRFSTYSWLALVGGLKTVVALASRNISVSRLCTLFDSYPESSIHLFFQCDFSYNLLKRILPIFSSFLLPPTILRALDFVEDNFDSNDEVANAHRLGTWKERNGFSQCFVLPSLDGHCFILAIVVSSDFRFLISHCFLFLQFLQLENMVFAAPLATRDLLMRTSIQG